SDFEEKLVTSWSVGTWKVDNTAPARVMLWRKTGAATPKLLSTRSLLNTYGYAPSAVAVAQPAMQPGGSTVTPGSMSAVRYLLPLTISVPCGGLQAGGLADATAGSAPASDTNRAVSTPHRASRDPRGRWTCLLIRVPPEKSLCLMGAALYVCL